MKYMDLCYSYFWLFHGIFTMFLWKFNYDYYLCHVIFSRCSLCSGNSVQTFIFSRFNIYSANRNTYNEKESKDIKIKYRKFVHFMLKIYVVAYNIKCFIATQINSLYLSLSVVLKTFRSWFLGFFLILFFHSFLSFFI